MSNFGKILLLLLLNVIVSASVTYGVLYYWENVRQKDTPIELITVDQAAIETAAAVPTEPLTVETVVAAAETATPLPTEIPAETQEPTPVIRGATIEIAIIRTPGVLSSEALRVVSNSDEVVNLENWTLEDADGNVLTFPNIQLLRKGVFVEVYSRAGHTTPYEIYWNRDAAVWQSGETAVIKDSYGQIQATYRVP